MSMNNVYFENISFKVFLYSLIKGLLANNSKTDKCIYYFIDADRIILRMINFLGKIYNFEYKKLDFKMCQIIDSDDEMVRIRIARKDIFDFEKLILNSSAFKEIYHDSWRENDLELFIMKSLVKGYTLEKYSPFRMLYLINVIKWHMKLRKIENVKFVISNRSWLNEYSKVSKKLGIELFGVKINKSLYKRFIEYLLKIMKSNTRLLIAARNIQYKRLFNLEYERKINAEPLLYLEGRGDVNFENNGYHSDFFWQLNSKFQTKNILYINSAEDEDILINNGVRCTNRKIKFFKTNFIKPKIGHSIRFKKEREEFENQFLLYNSTREYWRCLFKTYNVKIYSTWNIYDNDHMAKSDAINDLGGISIIQQIAFDSYKTYECIIKADIAFRYSKLNCDIEKGLNSKIKYKIIAGYPRDYATPLLKKEASIRRKWLKENGAKKIVFVIDENSGYDDRWHTGHGLQRENYSFILNKMMETPWLGVIFKPKSAKTLRKRLGEEIWDLLIKAQNTGRCYIYMNSGRHATIAPPLLAGLSADICIHGHLCAGTAALECALEGLPTLLIDREGTPYSKLYDLPVNKVIFKDWPSAINAIMEHFVSPEGIPGFGDWSSIIDDFDPFRDHMAAYRIGTYLHWLIEGFENNLDREVIMANAAERYKKQWGEDKVITSY